MHASTQATLFSSASGVHHTPDHIVRLARAVLNGIDLDPASSYVANDVVRANHYMVDPAMPTVQPLPIAYAGVDGLAHDWTQYRSVWLNPPFSVDKRDDDGNVILNGKGNAVRQRVIDLWVRKWRASVPAPNAMHIDRAMAGMLLVPARPDTEWFAPLWGYAMCFVRGRLTFSDAANSAPFPTVLVYAGANTDLFFDLFDDIGECGTFGRH